MQFVGNGRGVGTLAPGVQRADGVEYVRVARLVEIVGRDVSLERGSHRVGRQQHRAQERLLGLQVVRGDPGAGSASLRATGVVDRLHHWVHDEPGGLCIARRTSL